jgi:hypothetical protein
MRAATYVLNENDQDVLNGTTPDVAIAVALNAVQFWCVVAASRRRSVARPAARSYAERAVCMACSGASD